ncbi:MAG: DUF1517 domain-containing protein [Pleurocapsa sp.]
MLAITSFHCLALAKIASSHNPNSLTNVKVVPQAILQTSFSPTAFNQDLDRTSNSLVAATTSEAETTPAEPETNLKLVRLVSFMFFLLIFVPLGIFYPLFLFYKKLLGVDEPDDYMENKDNENLRNVTVSKLGLAFSPQASKLRQQLADFSSNVKTNTKPDTIELMRKTVAVLIEQQYWTHASYSSNTCSVQDIQTEFDLISHLEKTKFIHQKLSLTNRDRLLGSRNGQSSQNFYSYVVVTLILCTSQDFPLFNQRIYTTEQLLHKLVKLSKMSQDDLIKFELLWNPQRENEYITNEQLLSNYSDMIRLL